MTPLQFFEFQTRLASFVTDTSTVMTLRMLGMAGAIPADTDENTRMFSEKGPAFAKAMTAVAEATMAGKRPDQIIDAGMAPLSHEVRLNRSRLTK